MKVKIKTKHQSTEIVKIFKQLTRQLLEAMDRRMLTAPVFLDLFKAFNSLSHPILLHKLNSVDNSPETTKQFESYLTVGQSVRIGSTLSSPVMITHNMQQGAILSPLLFCIYKAYHQCRQYVVQSIMWMTLKFSCLQFSDKRHSAATRQRSHVAEGRCTNKLLIPRQNELNFSLQDGTQQLLQRLPINLELSFLGKNHRACFISELGLGSHRRLPLDI